MEYKRLTIRNSDGSVSQPTHSTFEKVFNRLAELEDKIEQGTLIELPCKVGDTVYVIEQDWDEDCKNFYFITEEQFMFSHLDYWGVRAFLTREEAEKRLKELQNGDNT